MARDDRRMTFIVVPQGGGELSTRSFELTYRQLRLALGVGIALAVLLLVMAASWVFVAAQAARVPLLQREVSGLRRENQRVEQLSGAVNRLEAELRQIHLMMGSGEADSARARAGRTMADSAAADSAGADSAGGEDEQASLPRAWPLAARGYVTRGHLARLPGRHPGIDIAVAAGSRVLAAGAGTVVEAGEDSVYGRYVRIAHGGGWESLYGHASELRVHPADRVRPRQVIALSGNTGVSTAPHLHFEIRRNGAPVDPHTLVHNPY